MDPMQMTTEAAELVLADLLDQFARAVRQSRTGDEPLAWRPEEAGLR